MSYSEECWKIVYHKDKKRQYIINLEKGESRWGLIPNDAFTLPIGWEAHLSRDSNKMYYANSEKKISQWQFPDEKDPELDENWIIRRSKKCKQIYYQNVNTGKTQWEFPKQILNERKPLPLEADKIRQQKDKEKSLEEAKRNIELQQKKEEERLKLLSDNETKLEELNKSVLQDMSTGYKSPTETTSSKFNPDNVKINWTSDTGQWSLKEEWPSTVEKYGYYTFNKDTLEIRTDVSGNESKISTVMIKKCKIDNYSAKNFLQYIDEKYQYEIPKEIQIVVSNIQDVIQEAIQYGSERRHKMFVLPSQLNGAEYQSQHQIDVVKKLGEYLFDNTGGPRGQLAADPGVAQFIIDNASNQNRILENDGINNVKLMGIKNFVNGDKIDTLGHIYIVNGYLQVKNDVNVEKFIEKLPEMTIMGVRDVPVRGLNKYYKFIEDKGDVVDLIYASAVPLRESYGNTKSDSVIKIANLTLFSQYVGAMRLAILRGNCDLYLTPLGGNAFMNDFKHIKAAIYKAYKFMERDLKNSKVNVKIIVWQGDSKGKGGEDERKAFGV